MTGSVLYDSRQFSAGILAAAILFLYVIRNQEYRELTEIMPLKFWLILLLNMIESAIISVCVTNLAGATAKKGSSNSAKMAVVTFGTSALTVLPYYFDTNLFLYIPVSNVPALLRSYVLKETDFYSCVISLIVTGGLMIVLISEIKRKMERVA